LFRTTGKTALLRALAGRHPTGGVNGIGSNLDEAITFNGRKASELAKAGINMAKLAAYAPQEDLHEPLLTVRETFQLAHETSTPRPPADAPAATLSEWESRVDSVIDVLGLRECESTVVGNVAIRGISGGQKKRVTVAEALLSNARVVVLDEATNGLDASTAFELVAFLGEWARSVQGTVVTALQVRGKQRGDSRVEPPLRAFIPHRRPLRLRFSMPSTTSSF
jgi:ABC-type multidrug transport system ATPase subunit